VAPEAGFRRTYMRTELEVRRSPTVDGSESWVDPLIGSRIGLGLTDRWTIGGEANVGGFGVGSDFTWNAQAAVIDPQSCGFHETARRSSRSEVCRGHRAGVTSARCSRPQAHPAAAPRWEQGRQSAAVSTPSSVAAG